MQHAYGIALRHVYADVDLYVYVHMRLSSSPHAHDHDLPSSPPRPPTGDTRGNVAAWRADGSEMWERHVRSLVAHGALAADVNGDGELEVRVQKGCPCVEGTSA